MSSNIEKGSLSRDIAPSFEGGSFSQPEAILPRLEVASEDYNNPRFSAIRTLSANEPRVRYASGGGHSRELSSSGGLGYKIARGFGFPFRLLNSVLEIPLALPHGIVRVVKTMIKEVDPNPPTNATAWVVTQLSKLKSPVGRTLALTGGTVCIVPFFAVDAVTALVKGAAVGVFKLVTLQWGSIATAAKNAIIGAGKGVAGLLKDKAAGVVSQFRGTEGTYFDRAAAHYRGDHD